MTQRDNIAPFLRNKPLLRDWFKLVCMADPIGGARLKDRLNNTSLNLELTGMGLVEEIREKFEGAQVIIEKARLRTRGLIFHRQYLLPDRLIYRAPHCQITLYAGHKTRQGRTISGVITVEVYAGRLPHEAGEGFQATYSYTCPAGEFENKLRHTRLKTTKTIDALDTDRVDEMLALQPLIQAIGQKEGLRNMVRHVFTTVRASYAQNDQWSADLKRLAVLANEKVPDNNQ